MTKKLFTAILSIALALCFVLSISACNFSNNAGNQSNDKKIPSLAIPVVSIDDNGTAIWTAVPYTKTYKYKINGGMEITTEEREYVGLKFGETISVKAVGDGTHFLDSEYSAPITYRDPSEKNECTHIDENDDGVCDSCGISVITHLSFYAINDLHGKYIDTASQPGVDELTTYIKTLYNDTSRYEVLLSSGDMWQGTVESSTNKGALMTEWMNDLGFVSMTLGNHEYDWGNAALSPNSESANFPLLAINVRYNNKPVSYCSPSVIVERGNAKIGIIGAIGNCLSSISGEFTGGLNFITGDELTRLSSLRQRDLGKRKIAILLYIPFTMDMRILHRQK